MGCPSGHGESWCDGECNWLNGECFQDVARDGTASQSSDYLGFNLDTKAFKAINGNTSGDCYTHECSVTAKEYQPWWKVDLHNIYLIHTIVIWNRSYWCMDRLNNAELKIYRDDILVDTKNFGDMGDTRKKRISLFRCYWEYCEGSIARYKLFAPCRSSGIWFLAEKCCFLFLLIFSILNLLFYCNLCSHFKDVCCISFILNIFKNLLIVCNFTCKK